MAQANNENTSSIGRLMFIWAAVFGLGVWGLDFWLEKRHPPSSLLSDSGQLILNATPRHHYLIDGAINGVAVTFFVDTGATQVAVPAHIAEQAGLQKGIAYRVSTANGDIQVYSSRIASLNLKGLLLNNVDAAVNPHDDSDTVLLGMSALKHFSITQQGRQLILTPQLIN